MVKHLVGTNNTIQFHQNSGTASVLRKSGAIIPPKMSSFFLTGLNQLKTILDFSCLHDTWAMMQKNCPRPRVRKASTATNGPVVSIMEIYWMVLLCCGMLTRRDWVIVAVGDIKGFLNSAKCPLLQSPMDGSNLVSSLRFKTATLFTWQVGIMTEQN